MKGKGQMQQQKQAVGQFLPYMRFAATTGAIIYRGI